MAIQSRLGTAPRPHHVPQPQAQTFLYSRSHISLSCPLCFSMFQRNVQQVVHFARWVNQKTWSQQIRSFWNSFFFFVKCHGGGGAIQNEKTYLLHFLKRKIENGFGMIPILLLLMCLFAFYIVMHLVKHVFHLKKYCLRWHGSQNGLWSIEKKKEILDSIRK